MSQAELIPEFRAAKAQHGESDAPRERGEPTRLINVLMVDSSTSTIERILRSLRDTGHAVQHRQ